MQTQSGALIKTTTAIKTKAEIRITRDSRQARAT